MNNAGRVKIENDGTLPLGKGAKVCLFGLGAGEFLFGGGGSGRVFTDRKITLAQGLSQATSEGKIQFFEPLVEHYVSQVESVPKEGRRNPLYFSKEKGHSHEQK